MIGCFLSCDRVIYYWNFPPMWSRPLESNNGSSILWQLDFFFQSLRCLEHGDLIWEIHCMNKSTDKFVWHFENWTGHFCLGAFELWQLLWLFCSSQRTFLSVYQEKRELFLRWMTTMTVLSPHLSGLCTPKAVWVRY